MASPPATGSAPSAAMATGPADEPPRTAAPRRKHVEELLVEIERRPEGMRMLDSLRRAGAIRGALGSKPPMEARSRTEWKTATRASRDSRS
ncbi:MAG: hypothetical protein IPP90_02315 [Gemmatimonadaceae bacterium]|nr:hypothetical protein [Gemmatimonadaceae bacterium]